MYGLHLGSENEPACASESWRITPTTSCFLKPVASSLQRRAGSATAVIVDELENEALWTVHRSKHAEKKKNKKNTAWFVVVCLVFVCSAAGLCPHHNRITSHIASTGVDFDNNQRQVRRGRQNDSAPKPSCATGILTASLRRSRSVVSPNNGEAVLPLRCPLS
jgi:hypothetical protein